MTKLNKLIPCVLSSIILLVNCAPLIASATSNAENVLEQEAQGAAEGAVVATLDNPESSVTDGFSTSQKEAYVILSNKYMTDVELKAMEWNLIVSQFAVPYRENIADVWTTHTAFKSMLDEGLIISDNPYLDTVKDRAGSLKADVIDKAIVNGIDLNSAPSVQSNMKEISDVMLEDGKVSYSMLYTGGGSVAYISDLFENSGESNNSLYIKDKIALTGDAVAKDTLWDGLSTMEDDYVRTSKTKMELASDVSNNSVIQDIELPVWIATDSTLMYNSIFVANAIRIGSYGTFDNFIKSLGNSQLYIDRWGNISAHCKVDGQYKYVIVYPAYANPIFTSTEISDDDFAGYVYEVFGDDFWTEMSDFSNLTGASTGNDLGKAIDNLIKDGTNKNWGSPTAFTVNVDNVTKTYAEMKAYFSKALDAVSNDANLGSVTAIPGSYTRAYANSPTNGYFGGAYSRLRSDYSTTSLIPILECDTTHTMMINKAIMSAYTRDNYSSVSKNSSEDVVTNTDYYTSDYNWYDCLSDSNTTYSKFSLTSQYNSATRNALFSNAIVMDKYYVNMSVVGATNSKFSNKGVTANVNGKKYWLQEGTISGAISKWNVQDTDGVKNYQVNSNWNDSWLLWKRTDTLHITDTSTSNTNTRTLYPFMLMNTYRKGLYSKNPTMQATKTKGWTLNSIFEDRTVSVTWNYENALSTPGKDCYIAGPAGGTDSQVPIELFWGAMYTDSDKFKTYVNLNYTPEVLPSNSVLYGMGHRLTRDNQGKNYYVSSYVDDALSGSAVTGRTYSSIPILDSTLDWGNDWKIWNAADGEIINSVQEGARTRQVPTATQVTNTEVRDGFFKPIQVGGGDSAWALRTLLNDQRVSDILENYPLEDITLLSFVWRNYYTPQTPFRTKLNLIQPSTTEGKHTLDGLDFNLGEDSYLPDNVVLTQSTVTKNNSSDVNNTLLWTISCGIEQEGKLSLGSYSSAKAYVLGAGEEDLLNVSHTAVYRASYNFGTLLLAINKNTQGDNLTFLVDGYSAEEEFDTSNLLSNIEFFFQHPVTAFKNIFLGFVQLIHNNVAVGNVGNIFNISWIIEFATVKGILQLYFVISAIAVSINLIAKCLQYLLRKEKTITEILRDWGFVVVFSTFPVILVYLLGDVLLSMSYAMTRSVSGELAIIDIEKEIASSESLNLNFETVYSAYKEQFTGIGDGYEELAIKVPNSWNRQTNTLEYSEITIRELYDSVEYSNVLADAKLESSLLEMTENSSNNLEDIYKDAKAGISPMYYSYEEFVPVNYNKYQSNVFYYFYDYIKYQYLAYWASMPDSASSAFSAAAQNYSLPNIEDQELWSTYVNRMWDAERYFLLKSYNGAYIMYHDADYVYNKQYTTNGKETYPGYYYTDMFGLSNLFSMTNSNSLNYIGAIDGVYMDALQSADQLGYWSNTVADNFNREVGNYGVYFNNIKSASNSMGNQKLIQDFYPLAYLMKNPAWNAMVENKSALTLEPKSRSFINYAFTPTYLQVNYGNDFYEDYPDLRTITTASSANALKWNNDLKVTEWSANNSRVPWRVYASRSVLYNHTYNGKVVDTETMKLENLLMDCNDNIYKSVEELTNYMQGDIRDATIIFSAALVATMEFNKQFSPILDVGNQIEPQTLTESSMDLDKFMRATFAQDINEIVKNKDVMYMISEQDGGLVTAVIIGLAEIVIFVTMIARVAILALMFIACAWLCLSFFFHPPERRKDMLIGVVSQILTIVSGQFALLFVTVKGMDLISETSGPVMRILLALLLLVTYTVVCIWSVKMLGALLKSIKTFGGAVITGAVSAAVLNYQANRSNVSSMRMNNNVANINAQGMDTSAMVNKDKSTRKRKKRYKNIKRIAVDVDSEENKEAKTKQKTQARTKQLKKQIEKSSNKTVKLAEKQRKNVELKLSHKKWKSTSKQLKSSQVRTARKRKQLEKLM